MQRVVSSTVEAIAYDPEPMELHVKFLRRAETYVYLNVPPFVYYRLLRAESKGRFLNESVISVFQFRTR